MPELAPPAAPSEAPAPRMLRLSAGFVYFYFGFLKFYTDLSPAEMLASQTIMRLWPWPVDAHTVLLWLAGAEVLIGLAFLFNVGLRWVLYVFIVHQLGTFAPLVLLPELTFKIAPFSPTIEGQYILKNLVSLSAGLTVMLPAVRSPRGARRGLSATGDPPAGGAAEPAPLTVLEPPASPARLEGTASRSASAVDDA